jgi:CheY-like chemotaxis protein
MARILVAEDNPVQARHIEYVLEDAGFEVEIARDGAQALQAIGRQAPDVVLTDLQMPEMDGLELVQAIRSQYPFIPVVLMTAHGSEEIAAQALQNGASSYVPKRKIARDIVPTLTKIIAVAGADRDHDRVLECVTRAETNFVLESDPSLIAPLVAHLRGDLIRLKLCDETGLIRVGVALQEVLDNAIYHGNLQLGAELRELSEQAFREVADKRRTQPPYRDRRAHVSASVSRSEAVYVVRDEGPGFEPTKLPEPMEPAQLESGTRGLSLVRTFMDEVRFNEAGNEITLVKRRERSSENAP